MSNFETSVSLLNIITRGLIFQIIIDLQNRFRIIKLEYVSEWSNKLPELIFGNKICTKREFIFTDLKRAKKYSVYHDVDD